MTSRYGSGKIYAIRSKLTSKFYIGSTYKTLEQRFSGHKSNFTAYKSGLRKSFFTSYEIIEHNDAYIELIEDFPCSSKKELSRREGELILKHKDNVVNERIAGRTRKESYAECYKKNKAKRSTHSSIQNVCECGGSYANANKARHMKTKIHQTYIASLTTITDTTETKP
jgi:hypothetical protein